VSGARWLILGLSALLAAVVAARCFVGAPDASQAMDGIVVKGPDDFRERTRESLDMLPVDWHTFVTQWLKTITLDRSLGQDDNPYVNVLSATFHVSQQEAFGWDEVGYPGNSIIWYACGMVHEAQHVYQYKHSKLKYGREAEYDATSAEYACLKQLGAPGQMLRDRDRLRECIHAGGCEYWKKHSSW
jgi:hypothetical protein